MILNCNKKDSDSIYADQNHTNSIQQIPDDSKNIGSIHDSADIPAIENILDYSVHYPVPASQIFLYGSASDPLSLLHDSSSEIVTPKVIPNQCSNPPNPLPYIPADPDSDPSFSDSSLSNSSDSSENEYYK